VERELNKYARREDKSKLRTLMSRMAEMDKKLKDVRTSEDLKDVFGAEKAAEYMVFYLATNGTLRPKVNRLRAQIPYENDIM
jgi:hypothetical protein